MASAPEESQLLVAVAADDRRAFKQLYSTYLGDIKRYLFLFTRSEDLAQELSQQVFINLWERRAQLPAVASLRSYLYRAAKNLAFDEVRRQQRQANAYAHAQAEAASYLSAADEALISAQDYAQAQALIRRLPAQRRTIFLLRTEQELSLDEIAERMNLSKSGVKKQLYSAVAFLKKNLLPAGRLVARLVALWLLHAAA